MSAVRLALAGVAVLVAVVLSVAALDANSWRTSLPRGDRTFAHGRGAHWAASTYVPGDPAGRILAVGDDLQVRRAVAAFVVAADTGRGFDNGVTRSRVRAVAEARLTDVADSPQKAEASQADDLLGYLATSGGTTAGGVSPDEHARDLFDQAVRLDPGNDVAKRNLELVLRRMQAVATRHGAGNGSGQAGHGRRGAGAGTPGRGY